MPTLNTEHFGLRLANLPLQNLRIDFNNLFSLFRSERFRKQFTGYKGKSIAIKTHHFTWDGSRFSGVLRLTKSLRLQEIRPG
jgi:hypothetical protein